MKNDYLNAIFCLLFVLFRSIVHCFTCTDHVQRNRTSLNSRDAQKRYAQKVQGYLTNETLNAPPLEALIKSNHCPCIQLHC